MLSNSKSGSQCAKATPSKKADRYKQKRLKYSRCRSNWQILRNRTKI